MKATINMTQGSCFKSILTFAVPILIGNIFQQIYSMVDTVIVGRCIDEKSLAAVGVTGSISFLMFSLIIGMTSGVSVVISQYYGANKISEVKRAYANSTYVMIVATIIVTVLGVIFARTLLEVLDTPYDIIDNSELYLTIIFWGTLATVLYNWMASVMRALGDSITPLIFLIISSVINVGFDLLFIAVMGMGVDGAAYATVISQLVSAVACLLYGTIKIPYMRLSREDFRIDSELIIKMIKIGTPAGVQASFIAVSVMLMQKAINSFGAVVVAGYVGASKIEMLISQFGNSIAMAAGTFTGQNVGANKYERVDKGYRTSCLMIIICCLIISPLVFIFANELMVLFIDATSENAAMVIKMGAQYLRIMCPALVTVGILQVYQQVLRSAGDVSMTMVMGAVEIVIRVTVAFLFADIWGTYGVWWCTPLTWALSMIVGAVRYYTGGWKKKSLIAH